MAWGKASRGKNSRGLFGLISKDAANFRMNAMNQQVAREVSEEVMELFVCGLDTAHLCPMADIGPEVQPLGVFRKFFRNLSHALRFHRISDFPFGTYCERCNELWVRR